MTNRLLSCALAFVCLAFPFNSNAQVSTTSSAVLGGYVVLGWNDLGMHCMSPSYEAICILPPYNNMFAHLIRRAEHPEVITQGVTLNYRFPANSYSVGKVNFWTYAQALFGVLLPPNIGLTGLGLTGNMTATGLAFVAEGIPLTPYEDAAPTVEQPYQFAEVTATGTGGVLDVTTFVAPTSVEMHCDQCHSGGGRPVFDNILAKHDEEEHTNLLNSKPVLCANCHADAALGKPGVPGLPSLSLAMHGFHADEVPTVSCYACHPGQKTQCLRGAMFIAGKTCTDCHGSLSQVASSINAGRRPWLDEPKCGTCHDANHAENPGKLYKQSTGHGGLYCSVCHNSPHAELPTVQPRDAVQAQRVQGASTFIKDCSVCHTVTPAGAGPHGQVASVALGITKTAFPNPVQLDGILKYTITVSSQGTGNVTGVVVSDPLPANVSVTTVTTTQGTFTIVGNTVTCSVGTILPANSATVTISVIPNSTAVLVNTATVSSNETASASATVIVNVGTVPMVDLFGTWNRIVDRCRGGNGRPLRCRLNGSLTVINQGTLDAPSSLMRVYLSNDATLDPTDMLIKEQTVRPIRMGTSRKVTLAISLPLGITAGGKYVIAHLNADGSIPEPDTANNIVVTGPLPPGP